MNAAETGLPLRQTFNIVIAKAPISGTEIQSLYLVGELYFFSSVNLIDYYLFIVLFAYFVCAFINL